MIPRLILKGLINSEKVFSLVDLTFYLYLPANNFCKQCGPRSGPTKRRAWSGTKLFDTLMVLLKEFLKKLILN